MPWTGTFWCMDTSKQTPTEYQMSAACRPFINPHSMVSARVAIWCRSGPDVCRPAHTLQKKADHGNRPETIHLRAGFILLQEVYEADIPLFWPRAASLEISEKVQKSRDLRPSHMLEACERPTTRSSCSIEFERSDRCDPVLNCYLRQVKMASGQVAFSKRANVVSVAGWDLCAASIDEP